MLLITPDHDLKQPKSFSYEYISSYVSILHISFSLFFSSQPMQEKEPKKENATDKSSTDQSDGSKSPKTDSSQNKESKNTEESNEVRIFFPSISIGRTINQRFSV